jgi:hypothetical protein
VDFVVDLGPLGLVFLLAFPRFGRDPHRERPQGCCPANRENSGTRKRERRPGEALASKERCAYKPSNGTRPTICICRSSVAGSREDGKRRTQSKQWHTGAGSRSHLRGRTQT